MKVTIDGKTIEVEPGTTILQAARRLGIDIPTMCYVEGFEPVSSCFVCAVQVEGRQNFVPACSMPVSDGMQVDASGPEVRKVRKLALELMLSDHAGDCIAPCRATCPAGLNIPAFTFHIAAGEPRKAVPVILERLALPRALGQVCPRLCEEHCHRGELDESLSIGALHRFAVDLDLRSGSPYLPPTGARTGKRVAIVGAGPAGLAAAFYLLQQGHACTLFDAHPQPGGMLRYGIPAYRLPRTALDEEIELIRRLGAEFQMNQRWGRDFTLAELREKFDAVFLAIGAQRSQSLRCPGEELAWSGVEFLEKVSNGERPELGRRVLVVGGGNTAMDVCRTAVRLGADEVRVLYRRTRREMPCLMEEVEGAEEEGVQIDYLVAPVRLERNGEGRLVLTCVRMQLGEPDESGRRRPVPIEGSEFSIEADTVIAAIGQRVETELARAEGIETTRWGIAVNPDTLQTNLPDVFAGGDAVLGPDLAVRAVAAGRLAAVSIDQFLRGRPVVGEAQPWSIFLRPMDDSERAELYRKIEQRPRVHGPVLEMERRRATFDEVEGALRPDQAVLEAQRCMTCGCRKVDTCKIRAYASQYQADPYRFQGERRRFLQDDSHPEIVYEPGKCILCEACVRVAAAEGEKVGLTLIGRGFQVAVGVPFGRTLAEALQKAGRKVAEVCPSGALALKSERACDLCSSSGPSGQIEPAQTFNA